MLKVWKMSSYGKSERMIKVDVVLLLKGGEQKWKKF